MFVSSSRLRLICKQKGKSSASADVRRATETYFRWLKLIAVDSKVGKLFEKLTMDDTFLKPLHNFQFESLALTQHQIVTFILMETQRDSLVQRNI